MISSEPEPPASEQAQTTIKSTRQRLWKRLAMPFVNSMNVLKRVSRKLTRCVMRGREKNEFDKMISDLQAYQEAFSYLEKLGDSLQRRGRAASEYMVTKGEIGKLLTDGSDSSVETAGALALNLAEKRLNELLNPGLDELPASERGSMCADALLAIDLLLKNASEASKKSAMTMKLQVAEIMVNNLMRDECDRISIIETKHGLGLLKRTLEQLIHGADNNLRTKAMALTLKIAERHLAAEEVRTLRDGFTNEMRVSGEANVDTRVEH